MLQARCFYLGLTELIVSDELLNFVAEYIPSFDIYHSCFVRFHHPAMTSNGLKRLDNIVSSPLHYDNYGADTRTTWVPLQDVTEETGSLCYTDSADLIEMSGEGIAPEQMHSIGLPESAHDTYIDLLRKKLKLIQCHAGSVVLFDKSLLHGSTYPKSSLRVSVDVRWITADRSTLSNWERVQKQFRTIRKNALVGLYTNGDTHFWRRVKTNDFPLVHLKMRLREIPVLHWAVRKLRNIAG